MFPHTVMSPLGDPELLQEIYVWLDDMNLKQANDCGVGDYLVQYIKEPATLYQALELKFKKPEHQTIFKLAWG